MNYLSSMVGDRMVSQYLFQMTPRRDLVAKIMFCNTQQALAEQPIVLVRRPCCEIMELLRERKRHPISSAPDVIVVQAAKSAKLVLDVAKALCNLQCLRERRAHLGSI